MKKLKFPKFKLVTISAFQKGFLLQQGISSNREIPWGIIESDWVDKTIDIVGVGNLITLKNFSYFLELVAEVRSVLPNLKVQIVGDGPMKKELEEQTVSLGLSETVSFLGEQNYEQTQLLIAQSKVLLHPANFEGFGMVFIEAMSNQTYVLSQKVGFMLDREADFLTLDLKVDARHLEKLVTSSAPQKELFLISETVNQYLEMYYEL